MVEDIPHHDKWMFYHHKKKNEEKLNRDLCR